jgi:chromate reductase
MIKLVALSGSTRKDSLNKKLLAVVVEMVKRSGVDVEIVDLSQYDMPIYNGDIEASGMPINASKLHAIFKSADGFIIASPEYNSSSSPLVKNVIDWVSRPQNGDNALSAFIGKTALLISASMGNLGGIRGIYQLRFILENIMVNVLPNVFALPLAHNFLNDNTISDEKYLAMLNGSVNEMVSFSKKIKS